MRDTIERALQTFAGIYRRLYPGFKAERGPVYCICNRRPDEPNCERCEAIERAEDRRFFARFIRAAERGALDENGQYEEANYPKK